MARQLLARVVLGMGVGGGPLRRGLCPGYGEGSRGRSCSLAWANPLIGIDGRSLGGWGGFGGLGAGGGGGGRGGCPAEPPPFVISPEQSLQPDHLQFGIPLGRIGPANRNTQDNITFDSTTSTEPEKGKDKKSLARSESQTELSLHASNDLFESCNNSDRKLLARSESESELSLHASNNLLERSKSSPELSLYASNQLFSPGFSRERHPSLTDSVPDDRSFRPAVVPQSTPKVSPDTTCLSLNPSFNLYRESRPIDSDSDSDDALSCEASNNLFKTAAIQNRANTIYYRKLKE